MTTQDERIATLEADARIKAANLELAQARVAELEAQNKALYDQMSMMAQYGKPPAQPDHQGHSCTHKCTWPQCEAAQPAPAQEPQPVSNTDELPQRLSDEMDAIAIKHAHKMALDLECILAEYGGSWYNTAMQTLGEYRSEMNAIHERESPTFMGEPLIAAAPKGQS